MRILEPAEMELPAAAVDPRYRATVLTAAYTGLRFGELAALSTPTGTRWTVSMRLPRIASTPPGVRWAVRLPEQRGAGVMASRSLEAASNR